MSNRPTATLYIQVPDSPTTPLGENQALAPAIVFPLADSRTPNGYNFQAKISGAVSNDSTSPESEHVLDISGLRGLTIREGLAISNAQPFVRLDAGYLDALLPPGTIFFGQLQELDYDSVGGATVWSLRATGRPIVLFDAEVHLSFPGRHTLGEIWSRIAAALGLRGIIADTTVAAYTVEDWVTSQSGRIEFARIAVEAQALVKESTGQDIKFIPTQSSITGDGFRFDLVPFDRGAGNPSIEVDLDAVGIHSHGPSTQRASTSANPTTSEASTPVSTRERRYHIVSDFDPQVLLGLAVAATSKKNGVAVGYQVEEYQHIIGGGPWKTQLSGVIQVDRSAEILEAP